MQLRIGTRASALARWQAEWVAAQLTAAGVEVELVWITTSGDRQQQQPLGELGSGSPGLFTKEIQRALLDGKADLAVHSLKDLPTEETPGLQLAAVPPRAPVGDALLTNGGATLDRLPHGALVGTGSLRRRAQLLHVRPDLVMQDLRGNVDTRLRKLREGQYQAIVLAEAGLRRLGLADNITQILPAFVALPAVGQGALGLEIRADDDLTRQRIALLNDSATHAAVLAERSMLATLRGGCLAPVAGWGRLEGDQLLLTGRVLSVDGRKKLEVSHVAEPAAASELGKQVAEALLAQGAAELIAQSRARM